MRALGRMLEWGIALVLTGAFFLFAGPYIGVWTLYWMVHYFG